MDVAASLSEPGTSHVQETALFFHLQMLGQCLLHRNLPMFQVVAALGPIMCVYICIHLNMYVLYGMLYVCVCIHICVCMYVRMYVIASP